MTDTSTARVQRRPMHTVLAAGVRVLRTSEGRRHWWRTSPRLSLARLLGRSGRGLAAALLGLVLLSPLLYLALTLASGALIGAVPGAVGQGFDSRDGRRLLLALAVLGAAFVAQYLSASAREVLGYMASRRVDRLLKGRIVEASLGPAGVGHLEDPEVLDKISVTRARYNGITPGLAAAGLVSVAVTRLSVVPPFILLATFRWWLPVLIGAALVWLRYEMRHHILASVWTAMDESSALRRSQYFVDLALLPGAAKETRIFGLGTWVSDRYRMHYLAAMAAIWRNRSRGQRLLVGPVLATLVAQAVGYVVIVEAALSRTIDLGRLTILLSSVSGLRAVIALGNEDVQLEQGAAVLPEITEVEALLAERREQIGGRLPATGLPAREVRFEQVGFNYPRSDHEVYRGLDLTIRAGESLAVVGVNGAGKTTLVKLLARLHDPTTGRITVDGTDLRELDPDQWQRRVAAIFQDFTRYELSAADNVGFGALEIAHDRAALELALTQAGAADIVAGLTGGLDTVLSRRFTGGTDLSGGQWQRIALARALLAVQGGAGILVLDEPTANLDVRAEAELYDRFLELTRGVTTVVISHRFSTVRRADRIVVLDGGRVVEDGTHDELLAQDKDYARMFRLQAARFVDGPASDETVDGPPIEEAIVSG